MHCSRMTGFIVCVLLLLVAAPCVADVMDDANDAVRAHENDRLEEAMALYTRAIDSGELPDGDNLLAYLYNNRGILFVRQKQYDRAMADFDQALSHEKDYMIFFNRGRLHLHLGENEKALDDTTQALMRNLDFTRAFHIRGLAKLNMGDIQGGHADLKQAKVQFPYLKTRD